MSAVDSLHPAQFPAETHLSHYGIPVVSAGQETDYRKNHRFTPMSETKTVPLSKLRGGQNYVDTDRVHDIAKRGLNDPREAAAAPPKATKLPDGGYMLQDGHHRVVGDLLRGKKTFRVHLEGSYGARYDGLS